MSQREKSMKKRILLITNGFPFGESERSFLGEEVGQLMEAFDLYILAPENNDKLLYPTDGIRKIERYRFASFREIKNPRALVEMMDAASISEMVRFAGRHHFSHLLSDCKKILYYRFLVWQVQQQISRLVQEEKIDIVYTYWCTQCTLAALYVKKQFPKLKVVTRFHGYDLYEERGWQFFRKKIAAGCDGLCFPSEMGRSYFLEHWKTHPEEKARTCYLGSKSPTAGERKCFDSLQLVSCSNVIPLKRIERIIEGLAMLPESVNVVWNHFGDGSERQGLEALAKEKLSANVQWSFRGFVPNAKLAEHYRALGAELFITTSSTEGGVPVSIQEALSMGIPVVGTAVGGIPEAIIDEATGFLLPENPNATDIFVAIMKYLNLTQAQRQKMSDAAVALWQDKFDAEKNARRFVAYLQDLVSN